MTNVLKKLAFPAVFCGVLWMGSSAHAQDIVSITAVRPGMKYTTVGLPIDFKITLNGNFEKINTGGATEAFPPEIAMVVNGDLVSASLYSLEHTAFSVYPRTEAVFRYTPKPGDMAHPLKIYGSPTIPYLFYWHNWAVRNTTTSNNATWVYETASPPVFDGDHGGSDVYDLDLAKANVTLEMLNFDASASPSPIQATALNKTWRVTANEPVASPGFDFYVWTLGTNVVQIGPDLNKTWLLQHMPAGSSYVDFQIKGLSIGTNLVYLQRAADYNNNSGPSGVTNYVTRQIVITAPPPPTMSIAFNGFNDITKTETNGTYTGSLTVELTQSYSEDLWVRLDARLMPSAAMQTNLTFDVFPKYALIKKDALSSDPVLFSVPDGTVASAYPGGVEITPVLTNVAAAAVYIAAPNTGKVRINNVVPVLTQPLAGALPASYSNVPMNTPFGFNFTVTDVAADGPSMAVEFTFKNEADTITFTDTGYGLTGKVTASFPEMGTWHVTVKATDKDGGVSAESKFDIKVVEAPPAPSVTILAPTAPMDENSAPTNTGSFIVQLSSAFSNAVTVLLDVTPPTNALNGAIRLSQYQVVIPSTTNAKAVYFKPKDGTENSVLDGFTITPRIIDPPVASNKYTEIVPGVIKILNVRPKVVAPNPASLPAFYSQVPMGTPFNFDWTVSDESAEDGPTMAVEWTFENGTDKITLNGTGLTGTVTPSLPKLGDWLVKVKATDKDFGVSDQAVFTVTVVAPPLAPTVEVVPPTPMNETDDSDSDFLIVRLSEAFTNDVTVRLDVTPANSALNGQISLSANQVVIKKGYKVPAAPYDQIWISANDGTKLSRNPGFRVSPVIVQTAAASNKYDAISKYIKILNVAPKILNPTASSNVITIAQGTAHLYNWQVTDVLADLSSMRVTWDFGDGTSQSFIGSTGSVSHVYDTLGDMTVRVVALDKDGDSTEVRFLITVKASKEVLATPIGPNKATYYGAKGTGFGTISSPEARSPFAFTDNIYYFKYDPGVIWATLKATPYASAGFDSFFFTWVGTDQGIPVDQLDPYQTAMWLSTESGIAAIKLTDNASGTTPEGGEKRQVKAIFSREYLATDNMGDINLDHIPDQIAFQIEKNSAMDLGTMPPGMTELRTYNLDKDAAQVAVGDFLPKNPTGVGGKFDFRPVGDPFTAELEVRGFEQGLNATTNSPDGNLDEPKTDPTLVDTDGDSFPDGWEYYFWYNAKFGIPKMTGSEFNPADPAAGLEITYKRVADAFVPNGLRSVDATVRGVVDLDKDGLSDIEELTLGTNPINWDTDGDGMCDAWELFRGLNPLDPLDGLKIASNNPDGDYMAITTVPRDFVTTAVGLTTNTYLQAGSNGTFTTWYRYGGTNAPIAVGRPVTLAAGETVLSSLTVPTNALIMHFQVYQEFGFDPRVAWAGAIGRVPALFAQDPNSPTVAWQAMANSYPPFARFAPWVASDAPKTRPFTTVDEYLLMKFMSENRVGGATGSMSPQAVVWAAFSTDPFTPDTDATAALTDGVPDGWELYISCGPTGRAFIYSPWSAQDYDDDIELPADPPPPGDKLSYQREYAGTDSIAAYTNAALYASNTESNRYVGVVSIVRPTVDLAWFNKFWPTDPWVKDSDGDGMTDSEEQAFKYNGSALVDTGTFCTPGGGLNPNSMDTDRDFLTDTWEFQYTGTVPTAAPFSITNGMDGTVVDWNKDFDYDGLLNYQEYWVQAVRSFRYDYPNVGVVGAITGNQGLPMDTSFEPYTLFTAVSNDWDVAKYYAVDSKDIPIWLLLPVGDSHLYVSTSPKNPDTDNDGMDDYYEMFHGLNPILGDVDFHKSPNDLVELAYEKDGAPVITYNFNDWFMDPYLRQPMNFITHPWLAGLDQADPDADGLLNLEEQLQVNASTPQCSNTDPSPLWMTDMYSTNSLTLRFYSAERFGRTLNFWGQPIPPRFLYSFEMNEGYDTDNDGVSDKTEMMQTSTTQSDPQDHDDPMRRQAMWFSGSNSVARTQVRPIYHELWLFRNFTVEMWARPESVSVAQVLIERPISYWPSDGSTTGKYVRVNFRIGIEADGRVYALFQNAGSHDDQTGVEVAYGHVLTPNQWIHIAARFDGASGMFQLLLNGQVETSVKTTLIPANGVINITTDPKSGAYPAPDHTIDVLDSTILLGAARFDATPNNGWRDYNKFYHGYIDEVRIWDGARSTADIRADYTKRYTRIDLLENRHAVVTSRLAGGTRGGGTVAELPPELRYHYTFDNLFSADQVGSVAQVPRGFNDPTVAINRPLGANTTVVWWESSSTKSTVYSDYGIVPWIENGVEHLPIIGGLDVDWPTTNVVLRDADSVLDSKYWSHYLSGNVPPEDHEMAKYTFPNSNNPYLHWYWTDIVSVVGKEEMVGGDLLPMGDAWAKQVAEMWDNNTPSGNWAETGSDTDSDGLPDWWETYAASIGLGSNLGWYTLLPDGRTAGERYMRDIANGATQTNPSGAGGLVQKSDQDNDGLPDWWENLYNLLPSDNKGINGAMGDPDLDGLSNYAEYLISEHYKFRLSKPNKFRTIATQVESDYFQKQGSLYLGEMFTDHDFMEGEWEDVYDPYYVSRYVYDAQMDNDQDGWSNWAESRYGASALRSDPSMGMHLNPEGDSVKDFPVPVIETRLTYNGLRPVGNILVFAYSKPSMDGLPDAIYRVQTVGGGVTTTTKHLGYWGAKTIKGFLSPGTAIPGSFTMTFVDPVSNDGNYDVLVARDVGEASGTTGLVEGIDGSGIETPIGTINYITGEYVIDLSWFKGMQLTQILSATQTIVSKPESSYVKMYYQSSQIVSWPKTLYLTDALNPGDASVPVPLRQSLGYIKEGTNYFFAMVDLNNNSVWDAGEPCGVSEGFGVDVGWDRNLVKIGLSDITPNYLRMTLTPAVRSEDVYYGTGTGAGGGTTAPAGLETRVRVRRKSVDGINSFQSIVLDKRIKSTRTYLHEGDLFEKGDFGLDWGLTDVDTSMNREFIVYDVFLGDSTVLTNAVTSFTNRFDLVRAKANATYPINGAYVYSARPTFKWTMPQGYTAFALEIRKNFSGGTVVYSSGTVMAPERDIDGNCVWTAPIHAGNRIMSTGQIFSSNTPYAWRVIALNPKFTLSGALAASWSDWKMFRLDVNQPMDSSGYGAIEARVKYYGPANTLLTSRVKVQAFRNSAFTGVPEAEYTIVDAGAVAAMLTPGTTNANNVVLRGLAPSSTVGDYYLRAYIDHNMNGVKDAWESWGYANYYEITDKPNDVYPINVEFQPMNKVYNIFIEDADTDQDWYPDAWEYEQNPGGDFLDLTGPSSAPDPDTEVVNSLGMTGLSLFSAPLALTTSDADNDGLNDMTELVLGTNPRAASTAGDGFADGAKVSLGLSPFDALTLNLTGLGLSSEGATLQWRLAVQKSANVNFATLNTQGTVTTQYDILYKDSLSDAAWKLEKTCDVTLDGVQIDKGNEVGVSTVNAAQRFYRIQLKNP